MKIIAVGEILWDIFPDQQRLGGAPFNFSAHAARLGHDVSFVSAIGADALGRAAVPEARRVGLNLEWMQRTDQAPTGVVEVSLEKPDDPDYAIRRPAAYDFVELSAHQIARLTSPPPEWIYFGTLHQLEPRIEALTARIIQAAPGAGRFYDINLRRDSYSRDLLERLLPLATVLKINQDEANQLGELLESSEWGLESLARSFAERFKLRGVVVTRGAEGCSLLLEGEWTDVPGVRVEVRDAVGAGDALSAAFLHGLHQGWDAGRIGTFANRVGALVASRSGAVPDWTPAEADGL